MFRKVVFIIIAVVSLQTLQAQKKRAQKPVTPAISAEQLKAEQEAKKQAALEAENKKKAEAEAERQRKMAEYEARTKRVLTADKYNKNSLRPILDKDIMFKKTVWRRLDMKEKQNRNFMVVNKELPALIMEYIRFGKLKPYEKDSLDEGKSYSIDEVTVRLKDPSNVFDSSLYSGDPQGLAEAYSAYEKTMYINAKDLTILDIKEDVIFDRKRSRMYNDVIAIGIMVPAGVGARTFNYPIAWVKFKELAELLRKDNRAIWFNRDNDAEHRNFVDAFDLRLFSSFIFKVSNPENNEIVDTYAGNPKLGRYGSEKVAMDLMEYEHNLWEF